MLELSGKLIQVLPLQTGNGKNGAWQKQDFVIETMDQYPKKVCFSAWADKADQVKSTPVGSSVKVAFNAESREFNGKWYTDLRIWKMESDGSGNMQGADNSYYKNDAPASSGSLEPTPDDLPF